MNTFINKMNLILLVLTVIFITPALGAEKEKDEGNSNELNYEQLDPFYCHHSEPITFEFYDFNDNLVFKTTVLKDSPCDAELAKYLNVSDFLTESGNTSYFRLNS